ncbi:phosphoadenosine phosphosulfate reductase family protein [Blautia producta]|uniref:phosphoadenosine phosphosulfate reductase domain-containing protein n=1 Tax=Blautia producta TaxID=33035 RepID=UPI001D0253F8|nr:phosphoadenosine phosphosulfate reductase family protein [Blautia producta]MCB5873732.1 phosphoadenosine phosphosulfate reductase family protein [Blautia producta]
MFIQNKDLKFQEWAYAQRKYLPYEEKVKLAIRRIKEWDEYWEGMVYVSFSGGLDSTVLLALVRMTLGRRVPAVFCNTGLEYPEIVDFARKAKQHGAYEEIRPEKNFRQVILEEGYPVISKENAEKIRKLRHGNLSPRYRNYLLNGDERGKFGMLPKRWQKYINAPFEISEKCCDVMKKKPFLKYVKRTGRYPFMGISQDESFRRAHQYSRTGCNVYDGSTIKSQPLGPWTKQDIIRFAYEHLGKEIILPDGSFYTFSICSVYGTIEKDPQGLFHLTGEQRTGCMYCAFGITEEPEPNRFQRMQTAYPKRYDLCMRPVENGGLGLRRVLQYMEVPYETWESVGQLCLDLMDAA